MRGARSSLQTPPPATLLHLKKKASSHRTSGELGCCFVGKPHSCTSFLLENLPFHLIGGAGWGGGVLSTDK